MIQYINCAETTDETMFQAFKEGFSDYIIKFEVDLEFFQGHFFGPEGNAKEYSWLAMDDNRPVGLLLGGIRQFDGRKTMRCGTMCVIPSYRKQGIAAALLEKHRETASRENCDQLFLECISSNEKALNFYRKMGYRKEYDLSYFSCSDPSALTGAETTTGEKVESLTMDELKGLRELSEVHINWQNDIPYLERNNPSLLGIKEKGNAVAALVYRESKIHYLYVDREYRSRGFASALLAVAARDKAKLSVSFSNSSALTGFYLSKGFVEEKISQVEMYRSVEQFG